MAITMVDREGRLVEVADLATARTRWEAGELGFQEGTRVPVVRRDTGEIGTIDATPAELETAFAGGFDLADAGALEEQRRARDLDAPVRTFVEQTTRAGEEALTAPVRAGLRLLSPEAGDFLPADGPQSATEQLVGPQMGERARANPLSATAGDIAGTIAGSAPLLALSPAAGIEAAVGARAAPVLGESLAGRVLTRGLAEAAGGAVEGAAFGGVESLAEQDLGNPALAAERIIAHMGMGSLLGGGGAGVLGVGSRLAREGSEAVAARLLPQMRRALSDRSIRSFAERSAFKASGGMLRDFRLAERRAGGVNQIGRDLLDEGVVTMDATLDDIAERAAARTQHHGEQIGALVRQLDEAGTGIAPSLERMATRIDREVLRPLRESAFHGSIGQQVDELLTPLMERYASPRAPFNPKLTFQELHAQRQHLDNLLFRNRGPNPPTWIEEARKARAIIEDELETAGEAAAQQAGGSFAAQYQQAKRLYGSMKTARDMAQDRLLREDANRFFSPSDYFSGGSVLAAGGLNPGSLAMGFVTGALHKFARERGRAFVAAGLDRVSRIGVLGNAAKSGEKRLTGAVRELLGDGVRSARRTAQTPALMTTFEDRRRAAVEAQANPARTMERLTRATQRFADAAPHTTSALSSSVTRAQAFLASKVPPGSRPTDGLTPHLARPRVSDLEARRFLRYAEAVENPGQVIDAIGEGRLTREGVEVLREVYPAMYAEVQATVMRELTALKTPPPYAVRLQLGLLLGIPSDPSLEPERLAMMQAQFSPQATEQASRASSPGAPTAEPDAALMSETDRLEARS